MKKVTFCEEVVCYNYTDTEEDKHCRSRYWENAAVDRYRFKDRIKTLEEIINPILEERIKRYREGYSSVK